MLIAEVCKKYDLSADTLRYYEKIGLISSVPRTKNGIRNYDEQACKEIEFIKCMRNAGVEIQTLLEYMKLLHEGKSTVANRIKLLKEQKAKLLEKRQNIDETIDRLNYKLEVYEEIASGKRKDFLED